MGTARPGRGTPPWCLPAREPALCCAGASGRPAERSSFGVERDSQGMGPGGSQPPGLWRDSQMSQDTEETSCCSTCCGLHKPSDASGPGAHRLPARLQLGQGSRAGRVCMPGCSFATVRCGMVQAVQGKAASHGTPAGDLLYESLAGSSEMPVLQAGCLGAGHAASPRPSACRPACVWQWPCWTCSTSSCSGVRVEVLHKAVPWALSCVHHTSPARHCMVGSMPVL